MQETSYPDPAQLRRWAREPMPFHDPYTDDVEIDISEEPGATILIRFADGDEDVLYVYEPSYMRAETPDESEDPYMTEPDHEAYRQVNDVALDMEIQEDFIAQVAYTEIGGVEAQYEAFWILDMVIVNRVTDD